MKFEFIGSFRRGEPVPDWLLHIEPETPSPPPRLEFNCDCHVFETSAGYWIVNDVIDGTDQIFAGGDGEYSVSRATKDVILPYAFRTLGGPGTGQDVHYSGGRDKP